MVRPAVSYGTAVHEFVNESDRERWVRREGLPASASGHHLSIQWWKDGGGGSGVCVWGGGRIWGVIGRWESVWNKRMGTFMALTFMLYSSSLPLCSGGMCAQQLGRRYITLACWRSSWESGNYLVVYQLPENAVKNNPMRDGGWRGDILTTDWLLPLLGACVAGIL